MVTCRGRRADIGITRTGGDTLLAMLPSTAFAPFGLPVVPGGVDESGRESLALPTCASSSNRRVPLISSAFRPRRPPARGQHAFRSAPAIADDLL